LVGLLPSIFSKGQFFLRHKNNEGDELVKQRLKPITIGLYLLGLIAAPALTQASNQNTNEISSRTQVLEQQVAELKQEIRSMQGKNSPRTQKTTTKYKASSTGSKNLQNADANMTQQIAREAVVGEAAQAQANANLPAISGPSALPSSGVQYLPVDLDVPGQSFVSTGPYIGVPLQYSGSDLVINTPSVNQDVALLNLRKNINQRLFALGLNSEDLHSHLLLSGVVEGQANYKSVGGGNNTSDINLSNAAIDAYILGPSTWTTGLITLQYDDNIGSQTGSLSINSRAQNSRLFVTNGIFILGDLNQSPWYGTIGQMNVPFGTYSSTMISSPFTKLMFRTKARALLLGYQSPNSVYGAAYLFKGDSRVGTTSRINNGGVNIGYKFDLGNYSGNVGAGVIGNIADSSGMQNTGNGAVYTTPTSPTFGGFGGVAGTGSETLVHRVPAYELRGLFSIGKTIDLLAEYVTASTSFNPADMTMKSNGAKPQALNAEATYTFQSLCKPTSLSVGYGMSKDGLALGMAAQRYSLALNSSLWRNTLQSLEFRHDRNYAQSAASSGSGVAGPASSGKSDNMITAQIDLFF
jgi:hypothetical protein